MNKPAKIYLLSIVVVVVGLTFLVVLSAFWPQNQPNVANQAATVETAVAPVDQAVLEQDYKTKLKIIVGVFESVVAATGQDASAKTEQLRTDLLALKVPAKFKELHLKLVMATDKFIAFLNGGKAEEKEASLAIIKQAKSDNDWLN